GDHAAALLVERPRLSVGRSLAKRSRLPSRLGSLVRGFSLFSPCVLDGVRRPPTCCGRFYESPVRSLATSQMDAAPDSGSIIKNAIWCTYRPVELGLPLSQALYVRKDAGTQRYNVGTDTPKLCATSRGRDRSENPRTHLTPVYGEF